MKNKIILLVSFFAVVFSLVSCLKDDVGEYWKDDLAGKVYATVAIPTLQQLALKPVPGDVKYSFLVNIATDALPSEDITLTLIVDPAAVTEYNKNTGKNYKVFPNVEVLTKTILIPKGTRNATAEVKVWGAESLDACDNFIAAVSIQSAITSSGQSITVAGNMKSNLTALPIANPYAGDYRAYGYRLHPSLGVLPVDKTETAKTVDCKTIRKSGFGDYPYDMVIEMTTDVMVVSGVNCFKVKVTVIDPGTDAPVSGGQGQYDTFTGDATAEPKPVTNDVNYYNPVTKTFVLNAYYNSAAPRIAYEVFSRL